ncbi:LysR family transcriptional regulator [Pseudomonas sp. M30-35]|uniref:LysR family transcriptional regulator n=1 Tax=Pseudomonas sp. M30-35 TaxID=1981174 RepID=UPI000B3C017C|nr:LysR family transcriptional regulator [Pseudomonas sp. M30-35]ARU88464.1 LysR family transcriptional regulator [Pseudomonas sp. M30-35]
MDVFQAMRVFARVVDSGSFTAAAQALDLSTAQVSRLVSELENHLQARLLQRTTRRLHLTEVGSRYLERCRQILNEMDDANAEASGAHLKPRGRLKVHSITGLGTQLLAPLAARYCQLFPDVNIDMTLSQHHPDLIDDGQDVVFTMARELPDSELVAQLLGSNYSVVCAAPSYLEQHGIPKSLDDLAEHRCLRLIDPVFGDSWTFNDNGVERAISLGETFQVNVAEAMAQTAAAGLGICLLPDLVAAKAFQQGKLVRILVEHQLHERGVYALYPSRRFLDAKVRTWVEFLKDEIPVAFANNRAVVENPQYWA